eukprot:TRINITY_DN9241_c0_g1_i1.p1 TRINITY_DN9241_c0_g1~~TRINITY_DN9241_c0_g1_i1.p1  ORF type:complete len:161 (+),score=32.69 TRINITY_DN9241_c0_g1_i1:96-578(+)
MVWFAPTRGALFVAARCHERMAWRYLGGGGRGGGGASSSPVQAAARRLEKGSFTSCAHATRVRRCSTGSGGAASVSGAGGDWGSSGGGSPIPVVKIALWSALGGLLLLLHVGVIIPQREMKEKFLRDKIDELQTEVQTLRAQLREQQRQAFAGKPLRKDA